jgi:hypothetical protein
MLNAIMFLVIMLNVIELNVIMLIVIMLNVTTLSHHDERHCSGEIRPVCSYLLRQTL